MWPQVHVEMLFPVCNLLFVFDLVILFFLLFGHISSSCTILLTTEVYEKHVLFFLSRFFFSGIHSLSFLFLLLVFSHFDILLLVQMPMFGIKDTKLSFYCSIAQLC